MVDAPRHHHSLATRLWHWINFAAITILFMSGLNIFNAHPQLYWGKWGFDPETAWLVLDRFPHWLTIPGYYSLAEARLWHFLAAWFFAVGFTLFLIVSLLRGHLRDFVLKLRELKWGAIKNDFAKHLKLDFSGDHGARFNFLQKMLYIGVLFVGIPLMIFTGLMMSPAMNAAWPWMLDLFGGRQSARSIHFIVAWGMVAFFVAHIVAVLLSGPLRQIGDMITGGPKPDKLQRKRV